MKFQKRFMFSFSDSEPRECAEDRVTFNQVTVLFFFQHAFFYTILYPDFVETTRSTTGYMGVILEL